MIAVLWPHNVVAQDVLELTNHVSLEGKVLNPSESPRKLWKIQMAEGIIVELPHRTTVDRQVMQSQVLEQYYAKVPFLPESVETHLKLAEVCMAQRLENLGELHYQRVLEIAPENKTARSALGHRQVNDEWISRDDEMLQQGYVKTKSGTWVTPQKLLIDERQVQIGKELQESGQAVKNLIARLKANPSQESENALFALTDPGAVPALADALKNEQNPVFRGIYVRSLAKIGTGPACYEIAQCAMREKDETVGRACVDAMRNSSGISKFFLPYLTNKDNTIVNRAARIIGQLNEWAVIPDLINALITQHEIVVRQTDPNLAQYTGSANNSFSGQQALKQKTETVFVSNPEVLGALRRLSGMDFGYEVPDWWDWWAGQNQIADFDARRGSRD